MAYLPDSALPNENTTSVNLDYYVDLIRKSREIVPVTGAVQRDQLSAANPPSPSNPLFVRREDTGGIEENSGGGWHSINPQTYTSPTPNGGTFTSSQLVVACVIPAAPFARLVSAQAVLYGVNIAGTWDAALSDITVSNWADSPYFGRFSNPQSTVTIPGTFALAAGQGTTLRGWIGYRSGGNQTFTASSDPKYSRIVATVFRAG